MKWRHLLTYTTGNALLTALRTVEEIIDTVPQQIGLHVYTTKKVPCTTLL